MPAYHKAYIEREKAGEDAATRPAVNVNDEPLPSRTDAEKEETVRRLKPHSRSQIRLEEGSKRPQGMTPLHPPKKKAVKWQFGIRSRNAPWEALLCIHKALHKLGATYVPDEDYGSLQGKDGRAEGEAGEDTEPDPAEGQSADARKLYKLPADPWHIRVRWEPSCKWRGVSTARR